MPTIKDRVFIDVALGEGTVTDEKVSQALATQAEMEHFGIAKPIAAILVERSLASPGAVKAVLQRLEALGVRCPSCGAVTHLAESDRAGNVKCGACSQPVSFPEGPLPEDAVLEVQVAGKRPGSDSGKRKARRHEPAPSPPRDEPTAPSAPALASRAAPPAAASGPPRARRTGSEKVFRSRYARNPFSVPAISRVKILHVIAPSPHGALYRIEETGAFGALKLIDPALSTDKAVFRKWIDYMRAVQDVPRTATLRPVQHSREGGVDYVTRPYVPEPGRSLRSRLEDKAPLSAEEVLNEATAVFASLAAFHSLKMAHGNLKPENVLLSEGAVQLTDPGLAILLEGLPVEDRLLRLADRARYAAPEVLQGAEATPASDVYSAGRILEDLLALAGADGSAQAGRSPTLAKLREIAAAFTSPDASERPPSAKEALRELQKAANPESEVAKDDRPPVVRRGRRSGRLTLKRLLDPAVAGVLLLASAAVWLGYQSVAWARALSDGRAGSRDAEISSKLILDSVRSLEAWAARSRPPVENVRARWDALLELLRGTDFEEIVESSAERSLKALEGPLDPETTTSFERVRAFASRRQWVEALEIFAESEDRVRKHPNWKDLEALIFEGVYSDLGMVYVPRGDVRLDCAKSGRVVRVPAFLADAALARDNVSRPSAGTSGDAPSPPARWLRLEEAQRLARKSGKRLLTLAEWRRLFEYVRSEEPGAAEAAKRIEGIGGPLLEWVECADGDSLSKAGYGWCVGGARPGVSPAHPVRRWAAYGYPDVAVRFAKSIEAPRAH